MDVALRANRILPSGAIAVMVGIIVHLGACDNADKSAPTAERTAPAGTVSSAAAGPAPQAVTAAQLTRVTDPSLVCMVNNQYMGKAQIPVTVAGKTYYGCCAMCKGRLETDQASRTGIDPVSRRSVDKATAVLAQSASGKMFYFESEDTFARYSPTDAE